MASKNFKDYQKEIIELEDNEEQIVNSLVSDSELLELDEIDIKRFCLELDSNINISELDNFQWEYNQWKRNVKILMDYKTYKLL